MAEPIAASLPDLSPLPYRDRRGSARSKGPPRRRASETRRGASARALRRLFAPIRGIGVPPGVRDLWDRLAKGRPEAWIVARGSGDGYRDPFLVVRNRSRFPIHLAAVSVKPGFATVLDGRTAEDGASAAADDGSFSATVDARSERAFAVILHRTGEEDRKRRFRIRIRWGSVHRPRASRFPVTFRTTLESVEDMLERFSL